MILYLALEKVKAMLGEAHVLGPQTQHWMTSVWAKQEPQPDFQTYGFMFMLPSHVFSPHEK